MGRMKLQFKFGEKVGEGARKSVMDALSEHGATAVRRLFPDEVDEELAALYVVDCEDESTGQRLLELLRTSKEVEFAEGEARRKLIR